MRRQTASKSSVNNNVLDVFTKYGLIILIAIFIIPYIYKYIKDSIDKGEAEKIANETAVNNAQNEVQNPTIQSDKATKYLRDKMHFGTKDRERLMASANKISKLFNRDNKNFWNPQTWTTTADSVAICETLIKECLNYKHIEWLYFNVYTKSRNLSDDIVQHLNNRELERARALYKKFNKNYF